MDGNAAIQPSINLALTKCSIFMARADVTLDTRNVVIYSSKTRGKKMNDRPPFVSLYTYATQCFGYTACTRTLRRIHSILMLLTTFGEEKEVMDALRVGTLGIRSAALVSIMFRTLYGEESAELAVADPKAWGLDKVCYVVVVCACLAVHIPTRTYLSTWLGGRLVSFRVEALLLPSKLELFPSRPNPGHTTFMRQTDLGGMTCKLLVGLTEHGATGSTRTFAVALHDSDPEFDGELLEAVAKEEGGERLREMVLESLSRALEEDDGDRRRADEEQASEAAVAGGGHGGAGDPFEGVLETAEGVGADELALQYGDAMTELVHTQVAYELDCVSGVLLSFGVTRQCALWPEGG